MNNPDIHIIDNLLSREEIIEYRGVIESYKRDMLGQIVCNKEDLAKAFWKQHGELLRSKCGITRLTDFVTFSCSTRHQDWHNDLSYDGDTHKILIYLDDTAGTLFQFGEKVERVTPYPGRAVVFDYRITHAGEAIHPSKGKKYTIGFRGAKK